MTAAEVIVAIDTMHPLEREMLAKQLTLDDSSTRDLLCEIEARFAHGIEGDAIVASCKRILVWEQEILSDFAGAPA